MTRMIWGIFFKKFRYIKKNKLKDTNDYYAMRWEENKLIYQNFLNLFEN